MTLRETLLKDASTFASAKEISLSRLAVLVVNDGKFFKRVQGGGDCTTSIFERFQTYFQDNTNQDAA